MRSRLIATDIGRNNFDLLRLCLAIAVLFSHCYIILYGVMDAEPIYHFSKGQTELGIIAVYGFFMISGFLIARSYERSRSIYQYLWKRAMRIIPGFVVAFLISVLLVGPIGAIYSSHPNVTWQFYFSDTRWLRVAVEMFTLQAPHPGVCFTDLACPKHVNASLWTIQHEAICYVLIIALAAIGLFQNKRIVWISLALAFAVTILLDLPLGWRYRGANALLMMWPGLLPKHLVYFLAGTACYIYRERLLRSHWLFFLSIGAIIASMYWGGFHLVFPLAGTYALFYVAFHPEVVFPDFGHRRDLSYGTYLYAWPVQQLTLYAFNGVMNITALFAISLIITILFATLSWHLVEERFMRMKSDKSWSTSAR